MSYMLITTMPLYSHKSFHMTMETVEDKINDILDLTERYYRDYGKKFEYEESPVSGEYPGIFLYKIAPENVHSKVLVGKQKGLQKPQIMRRFDEYD